MKQPQIIPLICVGAACILIAALMGYQVGKRNGAAELSQATNYDRLREVAFQGFFVAANRADVFFRGSDAVISRYPEAKESEERLAIPPKEREITERLVVQYYFSQDREIPKELEPYFTKSWDRSTFEFTKENGKNIK